MFMNPGIQWGRVKSNPIKHADELCHFIRSPLPIIFLLPLLLPSHCFPVPTGTFLRFTYRLLREEKEEMHREDEGRHSWGQQKQR